MEGAELIAQLHTVFDTPAAARMSATDYIASPQSEHKSDLIEEDARHLRLLSGFWLCVDWICQPKAPPVRASWRLRD